MALNKGGGAAAASWQLTMDDRRKLAIDLLSKIDEDGANLIDTYSNYLINEASSKDLVKIYRSLYRLALHCGRADENLQNDPQQSSKGWGQINDVKNSMLEHCRLKVLHEMVKSGELKGEIKRQTKPNEPKIPLRVAYLDEPLDKKTVDKIEFKAQGMFNQLESGLTERGIIYNKDFTLQLINKFLRCNDRMQNYAHLCELVYDIMNKDTAVQFMAKLDSCKKVVQ